MPTTTPLFEGQNIISGVLGAGASVFASFKPILILMIGLFAGFFIIYLIIMLLRGVLFNRINDEKNRQVITIDLIDKTLYSNFNSEVKSVLSGDLTDTKAIAENLKSINEKYKKISKNLKKQLK